MNIPFFSAKQNQPEVEPSHEALQAQILLFLIEKQLEETTATYEELAEKFHDSTLKTCFKDGFCLNEICKKSGKSIIRLTDSGLAFLEDLTA